MVPCGALIAIKVSFWWEQYKQAPVNDQPYKMSKCLGCQSILSLVTVKPQNKAKKKQTWKQGNPLMSSSVTKSDLRISRRAEIVIILINLTHPPVKKPNSDGSKKESFTSDCFHLHSGPLIFLAFLCNRLKVSA